MKRRIYVSPSILSADFLRLGEEIKSIEANGADYLHFDVMDGHFVPNISFGLPVLKNVKDSHGLVNDVHIMISNPKFYAERFVKTGADILTFHLEACESEQEVREIIDIIHQNGAKAGLSIKPKTDVKDCLKYLDQLDLLLVMSVEPGFGGQTFMPCALEKIRVLRDYIDSHKLNCLIEVDGGINQETGDLCKEAGVDILVAGSYLFGVNNQKERIEGLKK